MRFLNKRKWIVSHIIGKRVLDLGCIGQNSSTPVSSRWLHWYLSQHAKELIGVDINKEAIDELNRKGFNIICADVEELNLNDRFEVIVGGDIIEHLSNIGIFLSKIEKHLKDDGICLLSTPNPVTVMQFFSILFSGSLVVNNEHTCWLTKEVLMEACSRYNLEITQVDYVYNLYPYRKLKWWPILFIYCLLTMLRPEFCETHCYQIKKKKISE